MIFTLMGTAGDASPLKDMVKQLTDNYDVVVIAHKEICDVFKNIKNCDGINMGQDPTTCLHAQYDAQSNEGMDIVKSMENYRNTCRSYQLLINATYKNIAMVVSQPWNPAGRLIANKVGCTIVEVMC